MSKKDKKTNNTTEENVEEVVVEETVVTEEVSELDALKETLAAAVKEKEMYLDLLRRNQAEFDNFRKRNLTAKSDSFNEGMRNVIATMLPLIDNLERAESAVQSGDDIDALRQGIEMVFKQLNTSFEKMGVSEIEAKGNDFDPNLHDAVMQGEADDEFESGKVMDVFTKGYIMGDKVIRHSMVKVAK